MRCALLILALAAVQLTGTAMTDSPKTLRIAMAQIVCLDGDRSGNFARIEHAIKEAVEHNVDIICFPETALLGWVNSDAHQRAYPIPGPDCERLGRLAAQYEVYLCVGLAEKDENKLYNSVVLIDDSGALLHTHRKINILEHLMTPPYTRGDDIRAIDTPLGRIGMLICADTFVDDNLQRMAEQKPDIVLAPFGWAAPEENWPGHGKELHKTVTRAAQTIGAPVIGTDLVGAITKGPWAGWVYGGQSIAADKHGDIIAIARDRDRDIVIVELEVN